MTDDYLLGARYSLEAGGFRHCIDVLLTDMQVKSNGLPANYAALPIYYLASHAAELLLKAALLKRGHSAAELRHPDVRHDLSALALRLEYHRVQISTSTLQTIGYLATQHREHYLRYGAPEGKGVSLPHPQAIKDMLGELVQHTAVSQGGA